jgi:short subunit dehydrogenase-like uncharacterized protein
MGVECVVGGREPARLAGLEERYPNVVDSRVARVEEPRSLRALLEGCDVIVSCVGHIAALGEPVVRAAIETRTHYVDLAGDQPFIRQVFERHGADAESRGVALVPALGFDYALGDCIARLAASRHEPLDELVIAYALAGSGVAGDALESAGGGSLGPEVIYVDGGWRRAPAGVHRASFRFPDPLGRQSMLRYGSGEVITVPRHTRTLRVTSLITTSTWAPHPALSGLMPYLRPLVAAARRTPLRRLLRLAARQGASPPAVRERDRRTARFVIAAVARGASGSVGCGLIEGTDFDGLTAASLALGAHRLADANGLAGALPPAVAFEPASFLDALSERGIRWSVG